MESPNGLDERIPAVQDLPASSNITKSSHRQSLAEHYRNAPQSPRHRHSSSTQATVLELLNHPTNAQRRPNPHFVGRQWGEIPVGELTSPEDVQWVSIDSSVEEATKILLKSKTNVVLVRENESHRTCLATFDYSALNAYLLVVVGLYKPEPHQIELYKDIMVQAQNGKKITLRKIQPICRQEPLVGLLSTDNLLRAVEIFGGGIHRVLVTTSVGDVVGVLSQLRTIDFFWDERVNFPAIDGLYPVALGDLGVGVQQALSVNCHTPLSDALTLMNDEGLTSVAVVDNGRNVVGNISTKDVRHLTTTSSAPLLSESCMHFLAVILNERGVEKGRDAFPVFYVTPLSTLAHTVGKLTATRSHRMWIVQPISPSPSLSVNPIISTQNTSGGSSTPGAALPGAHLSGKLTGVISLTDVLNIFARFSGLHPTDPGQQRARRRRSSSSSMRPSVDFDMRR